MKTRLTTNIDGHLLKLLFLLELAYFGAAGFILNASKESSFSFTVFSQKGRF